MIILLLYNFEMDEDNSYDNEHLGFHDYFLEEFSNNCMISQFYGDNPDNNDFNCEPSDDDHLFKNNSENNNKHNSEITAPTSPYTDKNQDNKEKDIKIINDTNNINKVDINIDNKDTEDLNKKKRGRRAVNDNRVVVHTKYKEDNMMRKIKTYFMKFLFVQLNKSLKFTYRKFKEIIKDVHVNLNVDFNIELMNMTIKQIIEKYPLNKRFNSSENEKSPNYYLIQKIFEEDKEKETIRILNSKYIDIFDKFRTNNVNKFNEYLKIKLKKPVLTEEDKKYIKQTDDLLFQYEQWFELKKRKSRYL